MKASRDAVVPFNEGQNSLVTNSIQKGIRILSVSLLKVYENIERLNNSDHSDYWSTIYVTSANIRKKLKLTLFINKENSK